jgi:lytic murein transglycosylase
MGPHTFEPTTAARSLLPMTHRSPPPPKCLAAAALAALLGAPALPALAATDLPQCLSDLRAQAPKNRVSVADFDRLTGNVQILERVVTSRANQAEVVDAWWDYVPRVVDDRRVRRGRELLQEWAQAMPAIEQQHGVDRNVFTAIWGIESNYGQNQGNLPLLDVWVTRACVEQRPLWRANVYASLRMLRDGLAQPETFVGSWGGAFGLTQFIPTSFEELGTDGDGDGLIDLVGSVPDALASTANHLARRTSWAAGVPPVIEVQLPAALKAGVPELDETLRREDRRAIAQWAAAGATLVGGQPLPQGTAPAALFFPAGARGPAFLVTRNFDALLAYNRSTKYALSVALLAQRIGGAEQTLGTPWPTDDPGLGRDEIQILQELLLARGHAIGNADGIPGALTREAVRAEQRRLGLNEDGRTGLRILEALQREPRS